MRLLILGYSSIAERRVIPAAGAVAAIGEISIASRSRKPPAAWPKQGRFFTDYESALRESDADIVYLSLPNAMHEQWTMAALAAGKHVVVDKPAMMTREAAERAVAEARRGKRLLAEATVFGYHPQFRGARQLHRGAGAAHACRCPVHHSAAADRAISAIIASSAAAACSIWAPMRPQRCACSAAGRRRR